MLPFSVSEELAGGGPDIVAVGLLFSISYEASESQSKWGLPVIGELRPKTGQCHLKRFFAVVGPYAV